MRRRRVQRGGGRDSTACSVESADTAAATAPSALISARLGGDGEALVSAPSPTTATRHVYSNTGTGTGPGVDVGVGTGTTGSTGSATRVEVSEVKASSSGRGVRVGGTLTVRIVDSDEGG